MLFLKRAFFVRPFLPITKFMVRFFRTTTKAWEKYELHLKASHLTDQKVCRQVGTKVIYPCRVHGMENHPSCTLYYAIHTALMISLVMYAKQRILEVYWNLYKSVMQGVAQNVSGVSLKLKQREQDIDT